MRKTLGKVVLAVVIAGLLTGGIAIASAATQVRTLTTAQGTTVDIIAVTGTVTEISTRASSTTDRGFLGMFRHGREGYAKIKDSADGTIYTIELGPGAGSGIVLKVDDTVTVEGDVVDRGATKELHVWTFTGADGKTVTLRKVDGTPNIPTVTVSGTVTEVSSTDTSTGTGTKPGRRDLQTIKVKQADGTVTTVLLGPSATTVTVKVGDTVTVVGFARPSDSATVVARSFTGADGTTVTVGGRGPGGRGMHDGCFGGRGPKDGAGARGPAPEGQ